MNQNFMGKFLAQLTVIRPLLALSVDATRAATQRWTPIALELYFVLQARAAVGEAVASLKRRQSTS